jgi:hypothetical protein
MCADFLEAFVTLFGVAIGLERGSHIANSHNTSDKCDGATHLVKF